MAAEVHSVPVPPHANSDAYVSAVERILSAIAHDLKNPMSVVRGNAQLALLANKDERVGVCLRRIIDAVDAMTETLNEVHALRQPAPGTMEQVNIIELAAAAVDEVRGEARETGIEYHIQLAGVAWVRGDARLLKKAICHVLRNAIEAMPAGGVLQVESAIRSSAVRVRVKDTGSGIPPEHQNRVFREFFTTKTNGRGWGLIIVDRVIRVGHHGYVNWETGPAGTTVDIELPLSAAESEQ